MKNVLVLIPIAIILIFGAVLFVVQTRAPERGSEDVKSKPFPEKGTEKNADHIAKENRVDFSKFDPLFRFSAEVPKGWEVEFVPQITSLNIYDPQNLNEGIREKSRIFIRYFEASKFLTLSTVDFSVLENTRVNGHDAVRYEITKKPGVANFPHQPSWRNSAHKLVDVRLTNNSPSLFYVFSYAPTLEAEIFEGFVDSLIFHNDPAAFRAPLDQPQARATKKPFGIEVSSENSPVQPERFSGYHTGTDFEVFSEERGSEVKIYAICGGKLRQKQTAAGYGGVVVQDCLHKDQPVTVIYGHLKFLSVIPSVGEYLGPGDEIGVLGAHQSPETDGERKHLHLGIHKGTSIDIRGYVEAQSELSSWVNSLDLLVPASSL